MTKDYIVQSFGKDIGASSSNNINRDLIGKIDDVKTIRELIIAEKGPKAAKLMSNLTNVNEVKKRRLEEMERKYMETKNTISRLVAENDKLQQSYYEEVKDMQFSTREHFQWISNDHEIENLKLQRQEKELELRSIELQKREAVNQKKRKRLAKKIEENAAKNSSLQERRKANENMMNVAEAHKREKEKLRKKIIVLKKQFDGKQDMELERDRLKGQLNVMKYRKDDDSGVNIEDILTDLQDKKDELEDLRCLNEALFDKEHLNRNKLREAREELIEGLKEIPRSGNIGVKRMGELQIKPFYDAMKRIYSETEAKDKASKLCSLWQKYLQDPNWHPFKVITINGKPQGYIVESEEKLQTLKRFYGEEVYEAVMTAWRENNDYNSRGRYVRAELWNFIDSRRATLKEGVSGLIKMWGAQKRMRTT